MPQSRAFLNIENSLSGYRWTGPDPASERLAEALAQQARLPLPVARILAERGVPAHETEGFLDPKLRDLMPDPRSLRDMRIAAARIIAAVAGKENIAIFADYDVDGGVSAALLLHWLRGKSREATLYIPDRITEGYGPNAPAIAGLAEKHDLIICVDCGTTAHEALAVAQGKADVVVLDHHLGLETLPPVLAVVNPNRADESGELGYLCAAGVVYMTLVELNRQLREAGDRELPDLMSLLDMVALATVADVVPMTGLNRAFVRQGLAIMTRRENIGLTALADIAGLDTVPTPFHLGFLIGPRINAGGRIGAADLGARCLATTNPAEATRMAQQLNQLNDERRTMEAGVLAEALAQAEAREAASETQPSLAWSAGQGWHPGVVGIVASRLKDASNRPAVVIGVDNGIGKGSARSVPGVDLGRAVQKLVDEGLLISGGGHMMAAGLTVAEDMITTAMARLDALLAPALASAPGRGNLRISGLLTPAAVTPELWDMLERAGPFGPAAPAPRYAFADQMITSATAMGQGRHLRLNFRGDGGPSMEAIAWGAMDKPLGPALLGAKGQRFHLAGKLEMSHWQGRARLRLVLNDAALAT